MSKIEVIRSLTEEEVLAAYRANKRSLSATVKFFGCASSNKQARNHIKTILDKSNDFRTNVFYTIEQTNDISNIISNASSLREILLAVGLADIRTNRYNLKNVIKHLGLNIPDWKAKKAHLSGVSLWGRDRIIFKQFSSTESLPGNEIIKRHYLNWLTSHDKPNECSECQLGVIWHNKPITLQLDHIDGNKFNNILDNLRLLCPNCHSQTVTYCSGNRHKY